MHLIQSVFSAWRAAVAGLLVLQLLCVLAFAAMPSWHEWVHPEAGAYQHENDHDGEEHHHQEHQCGVTLFHSGACDCTLHPLPESRPALCSRWHSGDGLALSVVFTFHSRGVFEHAPPLRA